MYHCQGALSGINGVLRPGIVHRIDKDTTGSVIVCKNDEAHAAIAALLKTHDITRKYRAVVYGEPSMRQSGAIQVTAKKWQSMKRMENMLSHTIKCWNGLTSIHILNAS